MDTNWPNLHAPPCAICGAPQIVISTKHAGYQLPHTFTLYDCSMCATMSANPHGDVSGIYDIIYSNPARIAGYDRYDYFARSVLKLERPLDFLCERGQMYWALREHLKKSQGKKTLEVGSGLGYTTYALRRAGYDAHGIDLSTNAVDKANRAFGRYYRNASLGELYAEQESRFDVVFMTEVIEHVPDPVAMVSEALKLLKPNGSLFLTTPNRSFSHAREIWCTELPPVHLWWFSENSISALGKRCEAAVSFTDFTAYNAKYPPLVGYVGIKSASLDESGNVIQREAAPITTLRKLGALQDVYRYLSRLAGMLKMRGLSRRNHARGFIIGASLTLQPATPA